MLRFMLLAVILLIGECKKKNIGQSHLHFPKDFLIGAASSAYQVEGAWNLGG